TPTINANYTDGQDIEFRGFTVYKDNVSILSNGSLRKPKMFNEGGSLSIFEWSTIQTDATVVNNLPTNGATVGEMFYLRKEGRPVWWNGTVWRYADGSVRAD